MTAHLNASLRSNGVHPVRVSVLYLISAPNSGRVGANSVSERGLLELPLTPSIFY
jgi:hypothetical protein